MIALKCSMAHHLFCAHASHQNSNSLACVCHGLQPKPVLVHALVHNICACSTLSLFRSWRRASPCRSCLRATSARLSQRRSQTPSTSKRLPSSPTVAARSPPSPQPVSLSPVTCQVHPLMFSVHTLRLARAVSPHAPTFFSNSGGRQSTLTSSSKPHVPAAVHAMACSTDSSLCLLACGKYREITPDCG